MNTDKTASIDLIVSYFLKKGVTPLKLQKLLYYTQIWHFVKYKNLAFSDNIKAWVWGPVVPAIWQKFKFVKRNDLIPSNNYFYDLDNIPLTTDQKLFLDNIWNSYGHLSGSDLVDLTHLELPWKIARRDLNLTVRSDNDIVINIQTTKDHRLDTFGNIPIAQKSQSVGFFSS